MKSVIDSAKLPLHQLTFILREMGEERYSSPLPELQNYRIASHVRHIIEFYLELFRGTESGKVEYDARKRNERLETDYLFALECLSSIEARLDSFSDKNDIALTLIQKPSLSTSYMFPSSFSREVLYCTEHTIHHLALLAVVFRIVYPTVPLPKNFGVAYSTQLAHPSPP